MKRLVLVLAVLAATVAVSACGGSSSTPSGGGSGGITGTVAGTTFASVSDLGLFGTGDTCSVSLAPGVPLGVSMAIAGVSDVAYTCSDRLSCPDVDHKGSVTVALVIARAHMSLAAPAAAPSLATGSYTFIDVAGLSGGSVTPPLPDANGNVAIFTATVEASDATCNKTDYLVSAGTMNVTSVTSSAIGGTVSLTLKTVGGAAAGSLSGTFTASSCSSSPFNACDALEGVLGGSGPLTCNQAPVCM